MRPTVAGGGAGALVVLLAVMSGSEGRGVPVGGRLPLARKADKKADEPAWKGAFRKAYGLKGGELVRRVAPPYPECRAEHFLESLRAAAKREKRELTQEELEEDRSNEFTVFNWKDGWAAVGWQSRCPSADEGVWLALALEMVLDFPRTRIRSDAATLAQTVTGDFVVRAGADREKLAVELETVLRKECGLAVTLTFKDSEESVFVLSGKYAAAPLEGRKPDQVEVYAEHLHDRPAGGGGSGTLEELVAHVEQWVSAPVVLGKVEGAPKRVFWHDNARAKTTAKQQKEDHDPVAVLANVARQTGLSVTQEKRTVRILSVGSGKRE